MIVARMRSMQPPAANGPSAGNPTFMSRLGIANAVKQDPGRFRKANESMQALKTSFVQAVMERTKAAGQAATPSGLVRG